MNGTEIYNKFQEYEYNELVTKMVGVMDKLGLDNYEAIIVGTFLIIRDMDVIYGCDNGDQLREAVLGIAKMNLHYAGLDYIESDFFDPDDEDFTESADGLSWVPFNDLWNVFEVMAREL